MPLRTVATQRLYRQIADQIAAAIAAGEWSLGQRLPAERDLAKTLGVSRPSVREALIALEVEGLVEVRTGSGVYVAATASAPAVGKSRPEDAEWGPLELIRARRVLEGEIAALAAQSAAPRDLTAMERALESMRSDAARGLAPLAGDRAFHLAIARACGNGVLIDTVHGYWDARSGAMFERLIDHFETPEAWGAAIDEHAAVLQAIRTHDPPQARNAMHEHLDRAHTRFTASWGRRRRHRRTTP